MPCTAKAPVDCCADECNLGFSAAFGYETDYVWRGQRFAEDSVWFDLSYSFGDLTIGTWSIMDLSDTGVGAGFESETDLYASYALPSVLGFDPSVGYTYYSFPNAIDAHEFSLGLDRDLGIVGLSLFTAYDITNEYWYHEASLSKSYDLAEKVALDLAAGVGYFDGFGTSGNDSGVGQIFASAGLPIALNCRTTLTPYVAYNDTQRGGPISAGDLFHGGVSLSLDF